jgi:hypothetical protein
MALIRLHCGFRRQRRLVASAMVIDVVAVLLAVAAACGIYWMSPRHADSGEDQ